MKLRKSTKHPLLILVILSWLVLATACNMPSGDGQVNGLSEQELRQTFAAQLANNAPESTLGPGATLAPTSGSGSPHSTPQSTIPVYATARPGENHEYYAQSGDTQDAVARRFNVKPEQITSNEAIPEEKYIPPGQLLIIPNYTPRTLPAGLLLPDSEVIYSPSAIDFDIRNFIQDKGGFLSKYEEMVDGRWMSGMEIVERVAQESSVNPRLLLAFLEHRSSWVSGEPENAVANEYPIGFRVPGNKGLYLELVLVATHLNRGYYGWRSGDITELKFSDGSTSRMNPVINPGTAALQYLFSLFYRQESWQSALYGDTSFVDLYYAMFGDPWERASSVEPLFTPELTQPTLELPFKPGEKWGLTGGPHYSWNTGSPRGALDFSPVTGEPACAVSRTWVTASAAGVITRSANNVVVIDLDGDGHEQTGWTVVYVHIADLESIPAGSHVKINDRLGHPSCERGRSTGTHVHIARKYNGEWLYADGALPFILSGWEARAGERNYQGELVKGDQIVSANPSGSRTSIIIR